MSNHILPYIPARDYSEFYMTLVRSLRSYLAVLLLFLGAPVLFAAAAVHPRSDFYGNGTSDLLWRNGTTGDVYMMPMSGGVVQPGSVFWTEPNQAWQIVGTGDFDGDGKADILWWNSTTGQVFLMLMNGSTVKSSGLIYTEPDTNWQIVGVADFTGDGKADILWRNVSTGQVYLMPMNGMAPQTGAVIWTEPDMNWKIVATDKFKGTATAQILWWNSSTGQVFLMQPNGISQASGSIIYTEPNTNWQIVGSGDFNGDGTADVLWRNSTTGQVYEMPMLSGVPQTGGVIWTEANLAWQIMAIGDFDGSGKDDIVWRNSSTGQIFQMLMNGLTVQSSGLIYTESNTAWNLQGGGTHAVNRPYAYVVNQYDYTVSQLTMGPTGGLTALTPASVPCEIDPNSLAVDPSGKYLYVVNLKGATNTSYGSISQYTIGADGTLAPMTPAAIGEGGLFTDIAVHPSGKWAYAPTSNNSKSVMVQFTLGANGALTSTSSTPGGIFPEFIAIHPSGNFLYVSDSIGVVDQYTINPTTGALSAMNPATVPAFNTPGHSTFAITVHPSGKYAYVTDYYGGILEYTIDAATGALSQLAQTTAGPNQGSSWITIDPTGKYAYAANEGLTTAAIFQFTVSADGTLTPMTPASVAAASAATNVQVDSTGKYLYMTSGFGTGATNIVSQYLIGANGALTPMTPATVYVGSGPNAIVLVKR
jgi:6-phosphogluconolactonase (cycloisomerase 2 family)